ncbi:Hemolymph lipopolysaccharide-binding protein [Eumeta japonica]|uniref:Hemolymph lipopolysaccharide-binding protein n=1 Tax=Eumeta variegata TaxID=151549 RepID=A0A4C1WTW1_EUMVA|nr:Hemolymph lipopolysaccharide-binding protein [Eumeta japonica]
MSLRMGSELKLRTGSETKGRPGLGLMSIDTKFEGMHSMSMLAELGKQSTRKGTATSVGPAAVGPSSEATFEPEPKYRTDYRYVPKQDAFYKVHKELRSWYDAYMYCESEGSSLLYPKTEQEWKLFKGLVQEISPNTSDVWVGAHDLFAYDIYVDTDGKEISQYYAPWSPGEPSSGRTNREYCVEVWYDGKLNNNDCFEIYPFVCKRLNRDITFNSACQTPDPEFIPSKDGSRCYKVHKQPKTWTEAFSICNVEQAYLSIINDKEEAEFVGQKVKSVIDGVLGDFNRNHIAVGFHDKFSEGFYKTIHGQNLNSVYHEWATGQPGDKADGEDCGALTADGLLDDVSCTKSRMLFVCERDIEINEERQQTVAEEVDENGEEME